MLKSKCLIVLFLLICGCTSSGTEKQHFKLSLTDEIPLKGALLSGAHRISEMDSLFYILDTQQRKGFIFSKKGELVRDFGSAGRGPGEFESPVALATYRDSLVAVFDRALQRISLFDSGGNFLRALNVKGNGQQMVILNDKAYLIDFSIFLANRPMVKAFSLTDGSLVREISPASDLMEKFKAGISGASVTGLAAATEDRLVVLQHPMHLRIRIYDTVTNSLERETDLESDYFQPPDFGNFEMGDPLSAVSNAMVTGFYARDENIYLIYTEFHTGTKYMDIFTDEGTLVNEDPILLEKKWPRYLSDSGQFYSFAFVDSTESDMDDATLSLRVYELGGQDTREPDQPLSSAVKAN